MRQAQQRALPVPEAGEQVPGVCVRGARRDLLGEPRHHGLQSNAV